MIDSVQTLYASELGSAPGSVAQVREAAARLLRVAKEYGVATILVGHVTKDGSVAGPRVLEHLVDCVLQFEGDRYHAHRVLRAVKNRFGSTNELGVFEMTGAGLVGVPDPSEVFGRTVAGEPGAAVACALEGTRPILLEIQALVAQSELAMPRRVATGVDPKRLAMIVAVLVAPRRHRARPGGRLRQRRRRRAHRRARRRPRRRARDRLRRAAPAGARPARAAFGEIGLTGRLRAGRAGRAAARGVREARARGRRRPGRHARAWQNRGRGRRRRCGRRSKRGSMANDPKETTEREPSAAGRSRLHAHSRPRTIRAANPELLAAIAKIAPGTAAPRRRSTTSSARTRAR